jgi:hypothetical protein
MISNLRYSSPGTEEASPACASTADGKHAGLAGCFFFRSVSSA